jgi:hypothetical protein
MAQYIYAFHREIREKEVFFKFPKFPEIISSLPKERFKIASIRDLQYHASDAVITALQARISVRKEIPPGDNQSLIKADGFVILTVQQCMKLELFKVYRENCRSIAELARQIDKKETAVRRMLDLRHPSAATEIEGALEQFGKLLLPCWSLGPTSSSGHSTRPTLSAKLGRPSQPAS